MQQHVNETACIKQHVYETKQHVYETKQHLYKTERICNAETVASYHEVIEHEICSNSKHEQ